MKRKLLFWFLVPLILCCFAQGVLAYKYNANAGCTKNIPTYLTGGALQVVPQLFGSAFQANGSTPISVGTSRVQYVWIGANDLIDGPDTAGTGTAADDLLATATVNTIGDDSDTGAQFTGTAGKFFHYFQFENSSTNNHFFVRVWDNDPTAVGAKFGESVIFATAYGTDTYVTPNNIGLSDIVAKFPKAAPTGPVNASAGTPVFDGLAIKWNVPLSWNSAFGARKYEVYQVADSTGSSPVLRGTVNNANGYPAENITETKSWTWPGLNESTTYYFKIRAVNSFGNLDSSVVSFTTSQYPDPSIPVTVTDLVATSDGASITLTWAPPYDTNRLGVLAACTEYDIRVSTEAIVDTPVSPMPAGLTNPDGTTNWAGAQSIAIYPGFSPAPIIPAPVIWATPPTKQGVTIRGSLSRPYYFTLKARDESGNWSYLSNVAGIGIGGGGPQSFTLTLESGVATGKPGINSFSMPFAPDADGYWYVYRTNGSRLNFWGVEPQNGIKTAYELVLAINNAVTRSVVSSFGFWDRAVSQQEVKGIMISYPGGTLTETPTASGLTLSGMTLKQSEGYQVYIGKDPSGVNPPEKIEIVIKNTQTP